MAYPVPANEAERNEAVRSYQIFGTEPEIAFDEIGELAAQLCNCPISYIAFAEDDSFWFKQRYGLPPGMTTCPRELSFCQLTICGTEMVLAPDLTTDERYKDAHFVLNEPYLKFYCGVPLINPEGYALGTICVMDFEPRELSFDQQEFLRRLSRQVGGQLELRRKVIELDQTVHKLEEAQQTVAAEKARSDDLLMNILPGTIAEELKAHGKVAPHHFPSSTILFTDFRNFTALSERTEPASLIGLLDQYFCAFDEIVAEHGLEKIKTVGDAYMAVAGVPEPTRLHALDACMTALAMQAAVEHIRVQREKARLPSLDLRIGIHSGPVIAGVVGRRKFTYDIWGDAVNVAARLEANSEPNRVNISEQVSKQVENLFDMTPRGTIEIRNKAPVPMYFLDRLKPEFSRDPGGRHPNDAFNAERERMATGYSGWGRSA